MVPLGAVADVSEVNGPLVLTRYNMYPAASINGNAKPGVSSGRAIDVMREAGRRPSCRKSMALRVDRAGLPRAPGRQHGDDRLRLLGRDGLPGAGGAVRELVDAAGRDPVGADVHPERHRSGCNIAKMDINIFTQIGLVVLVGLASKNAILIVEFAKVIHRIGQADRGEATLEACRLRLRPIIMTSMAFILGVVPLLIRPRRRRRDAANAGHGRLQRHARRDALRHPADAGVLLPDRLAGRVAPRSRSPRVRRIGCVIVAGNRSL